MLVGATGLVGRHCLDLLLRDPFFTEVRVISRKTLYREDPKLTESVIDFDRLEEAAGEIRGDVTICCIGSTLKTAGDRETFMKIDREYVARIAGISHRNGCRHFLVVSAAGSNKNSLFFYSRVKGLMEEDIRTIPFEAVSIFQPSLIEGERKEVRVMEMLSLKISRLLSFIFKGSLKKYEPNKAEDIARAICYTAKNKQHGLHIYPSPEIKKLSAAYTS